jgi:peroxiredoxin
LGAIVAVAAAALMGFSRLVSLLGFALAGLAGGTALAEIGRGVGRGGRHSGRRYGGYLVHFGVILMALGVIGTRQYPFETEIELSPGEPVGVGAYTLVYDELRQETEGDHLSTWAAISVYRDGEYLATLKPRMNRYPGFDQASMVPALRTGLREDIYLVLFSASADRLVNVKVIVNPLISFLWLGGLVFLAGGLLALWPSAARAADAAVPRGRRWPVGSTVALATGLLVLVVAGVAMWQPGLGSLIGRAGRPLLGQPAPDFTLDLLDGSNLRLVDLRGQVVVLNFWTTWCPPCADELPDLEALWSEYQAQGVVFVGIAVQEDKVEVREMGSQFGLTYPLGLDPEERIATLYGITGVPETFVIDPQGQTAAVHIGPVDAGELRQDLDRLHGR